MKHCKKILIICTILTAIMLGGCSGGDPGTPPEVLLDGVSVVVGETKPYDLKEQGFSTDDLGKLIYELPERSWTSSIFLKKDNVTYAMVTLVNESKEEKYVSECVIEEIGFYALEDVNKDLNISINGINPIGMTQEELKEAFPELEMDDDESDYLFHYLRDGDYSICFEYIKGELTDIDVKHSFPKSYQSK